MSESIQNEFSRATRLLAAGQAAEAESICRRLLAQVPNSAAIIHLLGLARKELGDTSSGESLIRESIRLEPRQPDFHANLGNLLKRQGQFANAEKAYREAIALNPLHSAARRELANTLHELGRLVEAEVECRNHLARFAQDPQAWCTLGIVLGDQDRVVEAETAYRQALKITPNFALAHHNLGSLLARLERAEESLAALEQAQALGVNGFEMVFNRGRALLQLYRIEDAERAFSEAVALQPRHILAQLNLAQVRHIQGDPNFARDLANASAMHRDDVDLQLLFATVARRVGKLQDAETLLHDLLTRTDSAAAHTAMAALLLDAQRLAEAEDHAVRAATLAPQDQAVIETLVSILLARGKPDQALQFVRAQRDRHPTGQNWIAYEATAARLLGDPLYKQLFDYDRFVRTFEIAPPSGFDADFNAQLARALGARHRFANHPLDQSLRNGSQTARSLLTDTEPVIQAALHAFAKPINDYVASIGSDPSHPLTSRNQGAAKITGAWSVQLRRDGFHVNHMHPQGWISSAYYVSVPNEVQDKTLKSGWIKFGEPRFPTPGAVAEHFVQPQNGRLVLFPSYMWHGTNPIHGNEARTTIAFDALPA
jgi:Flp pilus assembly protein TadD